MNPFRLRTVAVILLCGVAVTATAKTKAKAAAKARAGEALTAVSAVAVPAEYSGACPAALEFVGTVKVAKPPVTIEYLWERSNGSRTQVRRIEARSGTQKITDEWSVGGAPGTLKVWEKLTILSPSAISSATTKASVNCR